MKKHVFYFRKFEKAQILPIVAIGMFAIIGLAAILLDGGVLMANRRSAQAAADAGALAGARLSCLEQSASAIQAEALYYAVDLNNADPSTTASYDSSTGLVTVVAEIEQDSWFARIFGEDTLSAGASASAGCYYPSVASRVMPIAFFYRTPPIKAGEANCDTDGSCDLVNWDFATLMDQLRATSATNQPLDDIYIVADKTKVCEKPITGAIVCTEMGTDGSGGNRTWLNLSELGGSGDLKKVIEDGLSQPLYTPAWINGGPGTDADVYNDIYTDLDPIPGYGDVEARILTLPLYKEYCESGGSCSTDSNDRFDYLVNPNQPAYRLVGFTPFVITCVTKNGQAQFGNSIPDPSNDSKQVCPGYLASNPTKKENAIEGYFVDGLPADVYTWGTEGVDAGIYIISLSD